MKVTLYKKPNGAKEVIDVKNVNADDAAWFSENDAKLSMEDIESMFAVYADIGLKDEDGEPNEAIEISYGRSCEDTFHALRLQCVAMLSGPHLDSEINEATGESE